MKLIRIEKFVDNVPQEQVTLPAGILRFLARFLPAQARSQLLAQNIDLDMLLNGGEPGVQWLDVEEAGVRKRIKITIS